MRSIYCLWFCPIHYSQTWFKEILLMEEILHQLISSLSHYLQGFTHPRWLFGISSINSIDRTIPCFRDFPLAKTTRSFKIIPATLWWLLSRICQPGMGWRRNSVHALPPPENSPMSPKQGTMFKRKWIIFQLPTIKFQGICWFSEG